MKHTYHGLHGYWSCGDFRYRVSSETGTSGSPSRLAVINPSYITIITPLVLEPVLGEAPSTLSVAALVGLAQSRGCLLIDASDVRIVFCDARIVYLHILGRVEPSILLVERRKLCALRDKALTRFIDLKTQDLSEHRSEKNRRIGTHGRFEDIDFWG